MVTHEDDIASYAKRRIVMKDGKIIREDNPQRQSTPSQEEHP